MHEQVVSPRILIIEDDVKLASLIVEYLSERGFGVHHAENGHIGLSMVNELNPDLVVLDLMMPVMDGLSVCRHLQNDYTGRVLVLTASDDDMDQVAALEMGAHDFVSKPIHPRVLLARVRSLLRREEPRGVQKDQCNILCFGQLQLNNIRRDTTLAGNTIILTSTEFDLLWLLAANAEITLSRDEIMQALRGIEHDGIDRSIDNKIVSLRKKLDDASGLPRRIITVRGKGYMLIPDQW